MPCQCSASVVQGDASAADLGSACYYSKLKSHTTRLGFHNKDAELSTSSKKDHPGPGQDQDQQLRIYNWELELS